MVQESSIEKMAELIDQKNILDQEKKDINEKSEKAALDRFNIQEGTDISFKQYQSLKKLLLEEKRKVRDELDNIKSSTNTVEIEIGGLIRDTVPFMTEAKKDGKKSYSGSFPNIGTITYTPRPPYMLSSTYDKDEVVDAIIGNDDYDCIEINDDAYIELNQRNVERQRKMGIPEEKIINLPGIIDRDFVDKKEYKIVRSRRKIR